MSIPVIDPRIASAGYSEDPIQRKLQVDELKKHIEGGQNKDKQLREACEGFEAVFIQKIWEQMRNGIPKGGYLHSRDEEMYQSLFDVEFSKKMASAGGIGLADMLYEQLNVKLGKASRATSPSLLRNREVKALDQKGIELEPRYGSLKRDSGTEFALNQSGEADPNGIYSELKEDGIEYINPYAQAGSGNLNASASQALSRNGAEEGAETPAAPAAEGTESVSARQRNFYGLSAYTGNLHKDVNAVGSIGAARQRQAEAPDENRAPAGMGMGTIPAVAQSNFSDAVKFIDPLAPGGLGEAPFTSADRVNADSPITSIRENLSVPGFSGMKPPFPGAQQTMGTIAFGSDFSIEGLVSESAEETAGGTAAGGLNAAPVTAGNVVAAPAESAVTGSIPGATSVSVSGADTARAAGTGRVENAIQANSQNPSGNSIPDGMFMRFDKLPEI